MAWEWEEEQGSNLTPRHRDNKQNGGEGQAESRKDSPGHEALKVGATPCEPSGCGRKGKQ